MTDAMSPPHSLFPTQARAWATLLKYLPMGHIFELSGEVGLGKTTLLQELHRQQGGALLQIRDLVNRQPGQHPLAIEETFTQLVMTALMSQDVVIVEDFQILLDLTLQQGYVRAGWLTAVMRSLSTYAAETEKTLIFCTQYTCGYIPPQAFRVQMQALETEDYEFLCHQYLSAAIATQLDYNKIFRFARKLNAHQLRRICLVLAQQEALDTELFIEYLRSQQLSSNVDLGEVQAVELSSLKGVDEIIKSLEANIILPLENDELAEELQLKPKRGVLLAGPPGTGKTTIGRALAHRLKSKFFLIDGTFISGTGGFYGSINRVFEAAKQNAPAIVFIDDTDVIFENGQEMGLYRYLLTLLDGLESQSAGRVCVIMTAMNIASLPPALVRSGRIELWLETRLPDEAARTEILTDHLKNLPAFFHTVDLDQIVPATAGFTGADLKRLVEDGKTLYAYDRVQNIALRSATEYVLTAVAGVLTNKTRYAEAETVARQKITAEAETAQTSPGDFFSMVYETFSKS